MVSTKPTQARRGARTHRTVVNPASSVRRACTVARTVRSARLSPVTCASHGVSEYGCRNTGGVSGAGAGSGRRLTVHMRVDEPREERHVAHVELYDLHGSKYPWVHSWRVELLRERDERLRDA